MVCFGKSILTARHQLTVSSVVTGWQRIIDENAVLVISKFFIISLIAENPIGLQRLLQSFCNRSAAQVTLLSFFHSNFLVEFDLLDRG